MGDQLWKIGDYPADLQRAIRRAIRLGMDARDWRNPDVLCYWLAYYASKHDDAKLYAARDAAQAFYAKCRAEWPLAQAMANTRVQALAAFDAEYMAR